MIYLNVTNTFATGARTGIQRVVRALAGRLPALGCYRVVVFIDSALYVLTSSEIELFRSGKQFQPGQPIAVRDLGRGDVFFDMDASWHDTYEPGAVWRQLKKRGCILAKLHYDAIPLLAPQYVNPTTVFRFVENFSSALPLFDYWFCISKATEKELYKVFEDLGCGRPVSSTFELGSDILRLDSREADAARGPHGGQERFAGSRYLLAVGTVEPRKNHELVLDAYEVLIDDVDFSDVHLVIVGKPGWNNEAVIDRIRGHREFGRRIHWLEDADDSALREIYGGARICLCLSHYEGFGLPVIEALGFGVPVICTADSVMEEIAKGRALGVVLNRDDVVSEVKNLLVAGRSESSVTQAPTSWDESARQLHGLLSAIGDGEGLKSAVRQAVYISIRPQALLRSIRSVHAHMTFIDEVVVLTADAFFEEMQRELSSTPLKVTLLRESEVGVNCSPKDHQQRNTTLRRHLYQSDRIDENFIALDDDYLVIKPVDRTVFVEDGVHKAYYFHEDGGSWLGAAPAPTSFDVGIWKTSAYLSRAAFDIRLYNSHQPQVINRPLAVEILNRTAGLGLDEWSIYFNIAKHIKPGCFQDCLYMTAGWPEFFNGWLPCSVPENIVFFNAAPAGKDVVQAAQRWRDELVQVFEACSTLAQVKLLVQDEAASFSRDSVRCRTGVKVFIPIMATSHVEYLSYKFLDHEMTFEAGSTPNFIATFKIVRKRDFRIDVVVKTRRSEVLTASLNVLVE